MCQISLVQISKLRRYNTNLLFFVPGDDSDQHHRCALSGKLRVTAVFVQILMTDQTELADA